MAKPQPYYNSEGVRVPSVTTILSGNLAWGKDGLLFWAWQQGKDGLDFRESRDQAATTGTLAHQMVENWVSRGNPEILPGDGNEEVDLEIVMGAKNAFQAFQRWLQHHHVVVTEQEINCVSDKLNFGGRFDAVGTMDGIPTLFDWKTSKRIYSNYVLQVAAYRYLYHSTRPDAPEIQQACIVRIGKDGEFSYLVIDKEKLDWAWQAFKALLAIHPKQYELDKFVKTAVHSIS